MNHENMEPEGPPRFWASRYGMGFIVIGAVAGYFLLTEHLAHVVGALPYLLLLACPLMHVFMHRGHGSHGARHGAHGSQEGSGRPDQPKRGGPS